MTKACFRCGDDANTHLEVVKSFGAWTVCPACKSALFPFESTWHQHRHFVDAWDNDRLCRYRKVRVTMVVDPLPGNGANAGEHMQLKLSAAAWLQGRGVTVIQMERAYPSGIADVLAPARRIAFECGQLGSSDERKLIRAVAAGWAAIWLPYSNCEPRRRGDEAEALLVLSPRRRARFASVATTGRYTHARPSDSSARYLGV